MKNKYLRKIRLGMFLCAGISSLFLVSATFADWKSDCGARSETACMQEAACQWNNSNSGNCEVRTKNQCDAIATVHWENGVCVKGVVSNTAEGAYQSYEAGDPGSCGQYATDKTCPAPYCKWTSRNQCVDANSDVCDTQGRVACKNLSQCKWVCNTKDYPKPCENIALDWGDNLPTDGSADIYFSCKSRAFGIGEGADEREADCNLKEEAACGMSEMCTWIEAVIEENGTVKSPAICHAKDGFMGIGTGKNRERRRLCNEAIEMLQVTNLTAGDQEMYEDQQATYCSESAYVETYQGPVFAGPGLKAGAQMAGGYLDPSISKERSLPKLAVAWTRFLLQLSAVLAVIAFITAGVFYITDFGDGSRIELAKKIMIWTVVGILLIMGSYAIVNTLMKARFGDTDRGASVGIHQVILKT